MRVLAFAIVAFRYAAAQTGTSVATVLSRSSAATDSTASLDSVASAASSWAAANPSEASIYLASFASESPEEASAALSSLQFDIPHFWVLPSMEQPPEMTTLRLLKRKAEKYRASIDVYLYELNTLREI